MFAGFAYLIVVIAFLMFLIAASFYLISMAISLASGAPYVATKKKKLAEFASFLSPEKNSVLLELGCGDGRVLRYFADEYGVNGIGIDRNPFMILLAQWRTPRSKYPHISYKCADAMNAPFEKADIVYLYLFPALLELIVPLIHGQCRPGTRIVSHGFAIHHLRASCDHVQHDTPFTTYFYTLT